MTQVLQIEEVELMNLAAGTADVGLRRRAHLYYGAQFGGRWLVGRPCCPGLAGHGNGIVCARHSREGGNPCMRFFLLWIVTPWPVLSQSKGFP
jgi:hypothetical protein